VITPLGSLLFYENDFFDYAPERKTALEQQLKQEAEKFELLNAKLAVC
jgi:hypothetical protein